MAFDRKYLIALFPLVVILIFFIVFPDIVSYIALAWVVSMIGAPLFRFFNKFKYIGRNAAAGLTLFSFVLFLGFLVYLIIPPLLQQARNLAAVDYNEIIKNLEEPIDDWNQWLVRRGLLEAEDTTSTNLALEESLDDRFVTKVIRLDSLYSLEGSTKHIPEIAVVIQIDQGHFNHKDEIAEVEESRSFFDKVRFNVYNLFDPSKIPQLFGSAIGFFSNFFIAVMAIIFVSFFFLKEQGLFTNIISTILPNKYETKGVHALEETSTLLIRYFMGITVQIIVITTFVTLALTILGIPNALLIGFIAALMNVIPYLGPILGASFGVIITVSSFAADANAGIEMNSEIINGTVQEFSFYRNLLPSILKVLAVFALMQLLDNFIFQPFIFGKSVKAHPVEIFVVVLMGAKVGGILGMVLAIPVYTILRVVAKVFMSEFKIVQQITKNI